MLSAILILVGLLALLTPLLHYASMAAQRRMYLAVENKKPLPVLPGHVMASWEEFARTYSFSIQTVPTKCWSIRMVGEFKGRKVECLVAERNNSLLTRCIVETELDESWLSIACPGLLDYPNPVGTEHMLDAHWSMKSRDWTRGINGVEANGLLEAFFSTPLVPIPNVLLNSRVYNPLTPSRLSDLQPEKVDRLVFDHPSILSIPASLAQYICGCTDLITDVFAAQDEIRRYMVFVIQQARHQSLYFDYLEHLLAFFPNSQESLESVLLERTNFPGDIYDSPLSDKKYAMECLLLQRMLLMRQFFPKHYQIQEFFLAASHCLSPKVKLLAHIAIGWSLQSKIEAFVLSHPQEVAEEHWQAFHFLIAEEDKATLLLELAVLLFAWHEQLKWDCQTLMSIPSSISCLQAIIKRLPEDDGLRQKTEALFIRLLQFHYRPPPPPSDAFVSYLKNEYVRIPAVVALGQMGSLAAINPLRKYQRSWILDFASKQRIQAAIESIQARFSTTNGGELSLPEDSQAGRLSQL